MSIVAWLADVGRRFTRRKSPHAPKPRRCRLNIETLEARIVPTLEGNQLLPDDSPWNHPITDAPVAAWSSSMIAAIDPTKQLRADFGTVYNGALNGIPYNVVSGTQPKIPVILGAYAAESDHLPVPIPDNAVIEGDTPTGPRADNHSDRHLIVYDKDNNIVYELYGAYRPGETRADGQMDPVNWHAKQETVWDLNKNTQRTPGFTSADAAGLPILPGLIRPDEVFDQGEINHAIRFTVHQTSKGYVFPASHHAGVAALTNNPRMGERFRLKADAIPAYTNPVFLAQDVVILKALQKYGMIVADNGMTGFIGGVPSPRWNDTIMRWLAYVQMDDFEVVDLTPILNGLDKTTGAAGTSVILNGLNFAGTGGTTQVFFGSTQATTFDILSNTQIAVKVPTGAGTVNVTVKTGYGTAVASLPFQYASATTLTFTAGDAVYSGNPYAEASAYATGIGNAPLHGTYSFTYYDGASITGPALTTAPTNVGTYTATAHFTSSEASYLDADSSAVTFRITPKELTIVADALSKTFGDADPTFTWKLAAGELFGNDAFSGMLGRETGENVGVYGIQQGTLTAGDNYALKFVEADFTIDARSLTVTADDKTKAIGATDPVLTYRLTEGNLVGSDTLNGNLNRTAGENVGTHAIQQGTLTAGGNYDLKFDGAILTIKPAPTVVSLTSSAPSVTRSRRLTFTAVVSSSTDGGTPTGKIQFRDGGKLLGTVTLLNGKATFTTRRLAFGSHLITATYVPDRNFIAPLTTVSRLQRIIR